ncbi:MAG: MotA/TolQ/ExbB proton channel family protein [Bacteroidales bacterium]|jgi:biopolymer transport protein ExbB/TolQ|nr:MotA/TolQ/ExbB proton channel family protein [Bacteroidales bacterium]
MEYVSNLMFWISNGLLIPVIVGLLFFFIKSVFMLGGLFNKYQQRNKQSAVLKKIPDLNRENVAEWKSVLSTVPPTKFTATCSQLFNQKASEAHRVRQIAEFEIESDREIGKSKTLTKFGPVLGLMGTLIPMGPALVGLSTGDIGSMAYNMQVAFATTVLGLFAGAVGFILVQTQQRWLMTDLTNLDFISDLLSQSQNKATWLSDEE